MAKMTLSEESKKYERMVADLVKLQFLVIRYVERHTALKYITLRDVDNVITNGRPTITYSRAVENLYKHAKIRTRNCKIILDSIVELKSKIDNSELGKLKFGVNTPTKIEYELDQYLLRRSFFMSTGMVGIKDASEMLNITESAIKQACQQERLLNTKKVGRNWVVHISECKAYWNVEDTNDLKY